MPPKDVIPRVMLWALGLAGALILALTTALFATHSGSDVKYREHNDARVTAIEQAVFEIKTSLAVKNTADERNEKLIKAIARKLQVSVSEVEDGQ